MFVMIVMDYKMQKQKPGKREEYIVQIGPKLMAIINEQMESIKEVTYGCTKPSIYSAGEIIAKKLRGEV